MDIVSAAISGFSASVDQYAFEINVLIKDQSKDDAVNRLMNAIRNYNLARLNLQTAKDIKYQAENTEVKKQDES